MLFHLSEEPAIARFDPRPSPNAARPVVWAVSGDRVRNYLLPRDCPRVTFFAGAKSSPEDIDRFLGQSSAVVAVESAWLDQIRRTRLFRYVLPAETFVSVDKCAGYFHSVEAVVPERVEVISDLVAALLGEGVELRFLTSLWPLNDAVVASSLSYSMIRMRNAAPRSSVFA